MGEKLKVEDEPGADERFNRAIKKALVTPPQPKKAKPDTRVSRTETPKD